MFVIIFFNFFNSAGQKQNNFFQNETLPPYVPTVLPKFTRLLDDLCYTRGQYRRNCAYIEKLNFVIAFPPSLRAN